MNTFRSEVIKLVNEKKTTREIYAELDRRSRILKEAIRIIEEIPRLIKFVDEQLPITPEEFEKRLKKFEEDYEKL